MTRAVSALGAILIALSMSAACAHGRERTASPLRGPMPPELQQVIDNGLPLTGPHVEFEGDLAIPPTLRGVPTTSTVTLQTTPGPHPPVEQTRQMMRAAAVDQPRVKAALGSRFALLAGGWLEPEKGRESAPADDRYQMVFYNYSDNRVVTVISSPRGEVIDVQSRSPKVQPPESAEEIEAAAAIVRRDDRYAAATRTLRVRGIQTEGRGDHRTLYLTFYEPNRRRAVYEATVDMTAGTVLSARALQ